jgi:hypothetical protein
MNPDQGLQIWPTSTDQRTTGRPVVPILIQVPALPALAKVSARTGVRVRSATSLRPQRRRRRLRREVRVAAYTVMLTVPMLFSPFWFGKGLSAIMPSSVPSESAAEGSRLAAGHRPPVISISIEPTTGLSGSEAEPPVVFPGYLLPDDDSEGPDHAGS